MSRCKQFIAALLLCGSFSTFAQGIPTIDTANLAQSMQNMIAWGKQYTQMVAQIRQIQLGIEAATGGRGYGQLLNAVGASSLVPLDIRQQMQVVTNAVGLVNRVAMIANSSAGSIDARAMQIQGLMGTISTTVDPKGIAEVQARIGVEQAAIANQQNSLLLLQIQQRNEEMRIQNEQRAAQQAMYTSTTRVQPDFTRLYTDAP